MTGEKAKGAPKGQGSFCVPRVAIEALLNANATAYEICTYLVLARYTDGSGWYSTAGITAVSHATGAGKVKGGPADRAIERLKTICATRAITARKVVDMGPILYDRATWMKDAEEGSLPDGPTDRGLVRFVLPDFGEPLDSRVWFGGNLVSGVGGFERPLKALKDAGDVTARLLLTLYAANDMETWGGVRPVGPGRGPWNHYELVDTDVHLRGGARLIRAMGAGDVVPIDERIANGSSEAYWNAMEALRTSGLIYEIVMVLNRNAVKAKFSDGTEYGAIPDDAEPYYELDARSGHGFKPVGEEGIGGATATTAGELGYPVATKGGYFMGTYAAIVPLGYPAMIAGLYRLRFRVANPKNAGVKGAWARIHEANRDALSLLQSIRAANSLPALAAPRENKLRAPVPAPVAETAEPPS